MLACKRSESGSCVARHELPVVAQEANEMGTLYLSRQFLIHTPPAEAEDCVPQDVLEEKKNLSYYF